MGEVCLRRAKRRIQPNEVVKTKFCNGNRWTLATLAATLMVSGVSLAQQATTADPYSGVSQPPPDTTIVADPDAQPAPPPAKPSPAVPAAAPDTAPAATAEATPPPVSAPDSSAPASAPATNPDYDIVGSVPGQSATPAPGSEVTLQTRPNVDDGIVERSSFQRKCSGTRHEYSREDWG